MADEKTILIVDDTETNVDILVELLADKYELMVAMSGEECLEILEMEKPDLILLDVMMPGMNGYEVCRKIKVNEKTKNIPVVFVTGKGEIDDKLDGYEAGGIDYLSKPIDPEFTLSVVAKYIS